MSDTSKKILKVVAFGGMSVLFPIIFYMIWKYKTTTDELCLCAYWLIFGMFPEAYFFEEIYENSKSLILDILKKEAKEI